LKCWFPPRTPAPRPLSPARRTHARGYHCRVGAASLSSVCASARGRPARPTSQPASYRRAPAPVWCTGAPSAARPRREVYAPAIRPGPIRTSSHRGRCRSVPVSLRRNRSPSVRTPTTRPTSSITGRPPMWFSSIIRMASATGVSRPTGTMVRVMTSALSRASPAFGGICRAAILASMSCSGRSECRAPGQFAAFGHSRTAAPAVGTRFTSGEPARNRRERSPSADNNRHLRT